MILPFKALEGLRTVDYRVQRRLAAVIRDPVLGGSGTILKRTYEYLYGLRSCAQHLGTRLILDD